MALDPQYHEEAEAKILKATMRMRGQLKPDGILLRQNATVAQLPYRHKMYAFAKGTDPELRDLCLVPVRIAVFLQGDQLRLRITVGYRGTTAPFIENDGGIEYDEVAYALAKRCKTALKHAIRRQEVKEDVAYSRRTYAARRKALGLSVRERAKPTGGTLIIDDLTVHDLDVANLWLIGTFGPERNRRARFGGKFNGVVKKEKKSAD